MKEDIQKHMLNHILPPLGIGYLTEDTLLDKHHFDKYSYFVILPLCIPFHKIFKIRNYPLLHHKDGKRFVYEFLLKILKANQYLENEYQMIHLDIKLTNIMYLYDASFQFLSKDNLVTTPQKNNFKFHDKMILLDYSLIKRKYHPNGSEVHFVLDEFDKINGNFHYYIWPNENENCMIWHIPTYSIGIAILEIFLGKERAMKSSKMEYRIEMIEEIFQKYNDIGDLLKKSLIDKIDIHEMFEIVKELYNKFFQHTK
jgi:hypothetical protein